jgi:hypothetical protein
MSKAERIAELNDAFRRGGSSITLTSGIEALEGAADLVDAVRTYDTFAEDNDPYHEHDFGSLDWNGSKVFWKIDYYDQALKFWENPLSAKCKRVLTIMLASEY